MTSRALFRWAAAALGVTAVSLTVGLVFHPMPPYSASVATSQWAIAHLFWWLGALAGMAGLAGLYLQQRQQVGVLGFAGSALAVLGLALIACAMFFEAFIAPSIATRAPALFDSFPAGGGWEGFLAGVLASGALFGLGFLLFGATMWRAGVMPRWAILLAVVGGLPFAVNFLLPRPVAILAVTLHAAGLLGLAYGLWHAAESGAGAARYAEAEAGRR
ncbi:MAG: hypothetical protein ACRELD_13380 [Longimicrobiales bacterium]